MTDKQCIKQIKQMMGTWQKGGLNVLLKECERLVSSGAVDLSGERNDSFYLSKIILHVALENISEQLAPISNAGDEIADNLRLF